MIPLSFAQARLWFLNQVEGPSPTYNVPLTVRLRGPLDPDALRAALGDVLARHEALRTVYPELDDSPRQQVLDPHDAEVPWSVTEVTEVRLPEALAAAAAHGFDLATELPLRAELFRVGPEHHALLLVMHHIAADGWSLRPLLHDLAAAFGANALAVVGYGIFAVLWAVWLIRESRGKPLRIALRPVHWWAIGAVLLLFTVIRNLPFGSALAP